MFYLPQEDSAADAWVKLGNVQPFANVDSTWIELYRIPTAQSPMAATTGWFGSQDATGTTQRSIEDMILSPVYAPSENGTAQSITAYLVFTGTTGTYTVKTALYDSVAGGGPIAESSVRSFNCATGECINGDYTFTLTTNPAITTGTRYRLAAWSNSTASAVGLGRATVTGYSLPYRSLVYGAWPNPFAQSGSYSSTRGHIYCTYEIAGAPTGPPLGTLMMMGIGRSLPRHPFAERVRNYMNQEVE